jgi:ADP-ribose pyrophosphatase
VEPSGGGRFESAGDRHWQVLKSERLVESPWITVRREHVRTPSGYEIPEYYLVDAPDIVTVLALTPEREVVLVEQYRHGLGGIGLELPAGMHDEPGESAAEAARRELLEETGYEAGRLELLGELRPSYARQTNRLFAFLALDCRAVTTPHGDPGEQIEVRLVELAALPGLVRSGGIGSLVSVGAIYLGMQRLRELGVVSDSG